MQFGKRTNRTQNQKPRQYSPQENFPDEEYGEMQYTEPTGNQILPPDSQEQIIDTTEKKIPNYRNEKYNNIESQLISDQPIPSVVVNIPSKNIEEKTKKFKK